MPPSSNQLRDRYDLVREIGRGGQAVTFLARDPAGREVALKQLSLRGAESWKALELFEREAEVLRNLSHPAIPAYLDSFHVEDEHGTSFFLAQELVDGETLQSIWDDNELEPVLTERQTLRLIREIAEILKYLHDLNPPVVHRDIKPANIFRRPDGTYALVDFGAVQALVPGTMGGSTFVGTSGYMAPEQLMGRACPASDIFSLGATAIHMLSGFHPGDLPVRRMRIDFDSVVEASDPTLALLQRMVEPDLTARFAAADELLAAVARIDQAPRNTDAMVVWDSAAQWPRVTEDGDTLDLEFPIAVTNSAASVGMFASFFVLFLGIIVSLEIGLNPLFGIAVALVMFGVSACYAFSRAHLHLDPDRFELRRKRLLAPDIVVSGRLGALRSIVSTVRVRQGTARVEQPFLVLEAGVEEEMLNAKKFDANAVSHLIDDYCDRHDE